MLKIEFQGKLFKNNKDVLCNICFQIYLEQKKKSKNITINFYKEMEQ